MIIAPFFSPCHLLFDLHIHLRIWNGNIVTVKRILDILGQAPPCRPVVLCFYPDTHTPCLRKNLRVHPQIQESLLPAVLPPPLLQQNTTLLCSPDICFICNAYYQIHTAFLHGGNIRDAAVRECTVGTMTTLLSMVSSFV